jgi:hypothetical protein
VVAGLFSLLPDDSNAGKPSSVLEASSFSLLESRMSIFGREAASLAWTFFFFPFYPVKDPSCSAS